MGTSVAGGCREQAANDKDRAAGVRAHLRCGGCDMDVEEVLKGVGGATAGAVGRRRGRGERRWRNLLKIHKDICSVAVHIISCSEFSLHANSTEDLR